MPTLTIAGFSPVTVAPGTRLVNAIEQTAGVDILHACGGNARCTTCRVQFTAGEPARITKAERAKLDEKGLTGVRLACQITCDEDMSLAVLMRLEGSGRPDPGRTPDPAIQPPPEWM